MDVDELSGWYHFYALRMEEDERREAEFRARH
jgi:hypothetical protein